MTKVEIIGQKRLYYDTLVAVHQLGILHMEDISKMISPGELLLRKMDVDKEVEEKRTSLETSLARLNSIISTLATEKVEVSSADREKYHSEAWQKPVEELKDEIDSLIDQIEEQTKTLAEEKGRLETELASLKNYEAIISKIEPLARKFVSIKGYESIALVVEKKFKGVLDLIHEEVTKITNKQFEMVSADIDENTTAALVFFRKEFSEPIHQFLWAENVSEIKLPDAFSGKPFQEALKLLKERKESLPEEIEEKRKELEELSNQWYARLSALKHVLEDRLEELKVIYQVGQTDYAFVIVGWVPKKYLTTLKQSVRKEFKDKVIVNELHLSEEELEDAPILLENPFWARAYEIVMKLFSPPKYGTIDPTPFVAIFYPLFFGLILGDVGYGLILLLLTLYVRHRYKNYRGVHAIATMLMSASFMVIFFGFIFGEFFGELGYDIGIVPKPFHFYIGGAELELPFHRNKPELIGVLLLICLGIGLTQIVLGQILGLINALREKQSKHAMEKVGMIMLFISILLFIGVSLEWFPKLIGSLPLILLAIAVGLLGYGGGVLGIVHMFGTIGKIFSYMRLMALGLAGVILAIAANEIAHEIGNIWAGIAIALVFHTINLVVHTFSSTIHSLRLNFIEFFDQFFEPGGRPYKPFKRVGG